MKAIVTIVIIALVVLFCIGAVNSNYNCINYLVHTLTNAVSFVGDVLHTEIAGIGVVAKAF